MTRKPRHPMLALAERVAARGNVWVTWRAWRA